MDVGMLRDASGSVGDIPEPSFLQVILIHGVIKSVIRIAAIILVTGSQTA